MINRYTFVLLSTVCALAVSTGAADAKKSKGPDPMIEQAIKESAQVPEAPMVIEPVPVEEVKAASRLEFLPSFGLKSGYESNIYRTDGNEEDDFFIQALPSVQIKLVDSEHEAALSANYEYKTYIDNSDEEEHNYSVAFDGRGHIAQGASVPLHISWTSAHENRTEDLLQDVPDEPLGYELFKAKGGLELKPGPFGFAFLGDYLSKTHDNGTGLTSGNNLIRDDADHQIIAGETEASYDINEIVTAYIGGRYGKRIYERNNYTGGAYTGVSRDSREWNAVAGTRLTFKNLSTQMYVGYTDFAYEDNGVTDIDGIIGGLDLDWNISDVTDIVVGFNRYVHEDDEVVNPIMRSRFDTKLRHALSDKWSVHIGGAYEMLDFEGSNREDDLYSAGIGTDYSITDRISLGLAYEYENRESDVNGLDFDNHIALIRANGKL